MYVRQRTERRSAVDQHRPSGPRLFASPQERAFALAPNDIRFAHTMNVQAHEPRTSIGRTPPVGTARGRVSVRLP